MQFKDTKPHYLALDGLRGVAALIVVLYHIFEGYATSPVTQIVNHGYLAVDFFFLLSGFVIGYAYDDRWGKKDFTVLSYFKRRLIRLHPMVVLGALIGAVSFLAQGSVQWDGTPVSTGRLITAMILTMLMIPAYPGTATEVRGFGEMFPLNGPSWSLFFEYLGNILYALLLRKASTKTLKVVVGVTGLGLLWYAVTNQSGAGNLGGGWSLGGTNVLCGSLRLLFSYSAGLLIARIFKPSRVKHGFLIATVSLLVLLPVPHLGIMWLNGLYDTLLITMVFPILLWLGASSDASASSSAGKVYTLLGDLSYPVYMVHYPVMYLFYAYLWKDGLGLADSWFVAIGVYLGSLILGYLAYRLYDLPVRKWLTKRYMSPKP